MSDTVNLGFVDVDSGTIFIGDPCYTATDDASHRIKTWSEWCEKTRGMFDSHFPVSEIGKPGLGLTIGTLHGDGSYPVTGILKNGRIAKVVIDFDWEEDDDE